MSKSANHDSHTAANRGAITTLIVDDSPRWVKSLRTFLALHPVIGIPLPLVSYGGSALLPSLVALGLLIGFARREPEAARALAQRKKARSAGLSAGRVS